MKTKLLAFIALALALALAAEAQQSALTSRLNRRPSNAAQNVAAAGGAAAEKKPDGGHALNWENAPSDIILMAYADELGKTVLIDPACPKGVSITLKSKQGQPLSREDYLEAIRTVLEMNGIHIEPYKDSFIRAIPRKDARKEGIPLIMDHEAKLGESGKVVSMMIPFENMSAEDAQKVLEGFKSNTGLLIVFERTNKILVTDTEQNINRMLEIARAIDVATPVTEQVFVRQVRHADVADVQKALQAIVEDALRQQTAAKTPAVAQQQQRPSPPLLRGPGARRQQEAPQPAASNESLYLGVSDADRGMIRGRVLIVPDERSNKLIIITSKANMDFFDKVIEQLDVETTPDTVVKVYRLKYADAEDVSDMINDLIGNAPSSKSTGKNQNQNAKQGSSTTVTGRGGSQSSSSAAKKPANQRTGEAKPGELSKENTTVLADKRINGIVVMTNKELVPTIEQIIESMDIKLSQVLIETVIIEVTLGDGLNTGIDWVRNGRQTSTPVYAAKKEWLTTDSSGKTSVSKTEIDTSTLVPSWFTKTDASSGETIRYSADTDGGVRGSMSDFVKNGLWTGAMGYMSAMGGGSSGGQAAAEVALGTATNLFGSSFNYLFKSDKLNLSAIIQASKNDSRTKYIASPIVMTVDNKEATIDATESRKFFSGYETSSSYSTYMRTPKYDSKDIGIKIKVTPKINPNGTVMLEIEEEYSQVREGGQSILVGEGSATANIDTALERKMSADALLENMQTVILCGLTESYKSDSETGIPILKDIPWIGKWLFSTVSQQENRKELLIFMTPYVLDDGDAAQAEAIRRKKAISDSRPWEDNGWSLSQLADPVSRKEVLRRLEDEAKKQDEERQTKIATEKWKIDRAKKLKNLTKEERDLWLKMHKEELDEEAQEELEEKMLDDKSQEELRKLAADIRARKLAESEAELKKAEDETAAENERGKRDAAKENGEPAPAASLLGDVEAQ